MASERLPTEEEWQAWLAHPVTEVLREWARKKQAGLQATWASGAFSHPDDVKSLAANHAALGGHSVYQEVVELDFQFILGEFHE